MRESDPRATPRRSRAMPVQTKKVLASALSLGDATGKKIRKSSPGPYSSPGNAEFSRMALWANSRTRVYMQRDNSQARASRLHTLTDHRFANARCTLKAIILRRRFWKAFGRRQTRDREWKTPRQIFFRNFCHPKCAVMKLQRSELSSSASPPVGTDARQPSLEIYSLKTDNFAGVRARVAFSSYGWFALLSQPVVPRRYRSELAEFPAAAGTRSRLRMNSARPASPGRQLRSSLSLVGPRCGATATRETATSFTSARKRR